MNIPDCGRDPSERPLLCVLLSAPPPPVRTGAKGGPGVFPGPGCSCLLIRDCTLQGTVSACGVQRGGIKDRDQITPFPLGARTHTGYKG